MPLLIWLSIPALALDAVDGWIARRTHTVSELGARFDMEVDAFLLLVLSAYVAQDLGLVGAHIGAAPLRLRRGGMGAAVDAGDAPAAVLAQGRDGGRRHRAGGRRIRAPPGVGSDSPRSLVALALLLESFGRDVLWLIRRRRT